MLSASLRARGAVPPLKSLARPFAAQSQQSHKAKSMLSDPAVSVVIPLAGMRTLWRVACPVLLTYVWFTRQVYPLLGIVGTGITAATFFMVWSAYSNQDVR